MKRTFLKLLCFAVIGISSHPTAWAQSYSGMVSFGDSLSDLGNTIATLSVFGEPFVRDQTGYNAYFYFNGRFSNGPLWSDRLNDQLNFGPMLRNNGVDLLTGSNFAWAGSTSGTGNTGVFLPNLRTQVDFYTTQIPTSPFLPDSATTLFTIWSGGNDVINLVDHGTLITPEEVAENISMAITDLYDAGGRTFLVPNLPPLGYKPDYVFDPVKQAAANAFVDSYNLLLENTLNTLSGNLAGSTIIELNIHEIFLEIIVNPAGYGLTNVTETAYTPFGGTNPPPPYGSVVGNPEQYLFWDSSHATTSINFLIAQEAYAAVVPEPAAGTLVLIGGIVALSLSRKRNQPSLSL
jgi:phospholipase/lecithinase/hemolysin